MVINRNAATLMRPTGVGDLAYFQGLNPRRFMPVLILMNTSSGRVRRGGLQHAHVLDVVHNYGQATRCDFRQLVRTINPSSKNAAHSVLTQRDGGVELEPEYKSVGVAKRRQNAQQTVAKALALTTASNCAPADFRARRANSCALPRD
jgi:hypothetical protein